MKKILTLFFITIIPFLLPAQSFLQNIKVQPGIRIQTFPNSKIRNWNRYIKTNPEISIIYASPNKKYHFAYRKIISYDIGPRINSNAIVRADIFSEYHEANELDFFYQVNKKQKSPIYLGLGYFNNTRLETYYQQGFRGNHNYHGVTFTGKITINEYNIEFRKLIEITPLIGVFDSHHYAISINRTFDFIKQDKVAQPSKINFYPIFSMRMHPVKYYEKKSALFNPIGFSPGIGIGFFVKKWNTEFFISRDYWVRFSGGLTSSDIIGYISTNNLGVKYFWKTQKNRTFNVGLMFNPIYNRNEFEQGVAYRTVTDQLGNEVEIFHYKPATIKGIGCSLGYQLAPKLDVEFRQIFPIKGDYFFNPWYSSIGLNWRLR